ncbi:hypothetical protein J5O02_01280 [Streptococcus suis]|uniref:hypothetical protein n=1 Tax=Streptococcus suis TaxID=1307 RepID=UPI000CF6A8B4|nr:hypothetical protein [Streptococcus suis]MBO3755708.1 hypothetical protein [Streptococcus suis]
MNKQELEKQAEALYTDVRSFLDNTFELIDQIHEPQKVVVPKVCTGCRCLNRRRRWSDEEIHCE